MKLEPYRIGGKRSARQSRPLDRAFALLDPLLACPALVVERNDALGRAAHVRHDEADARIQFARMPLDLGDNPPRLGPDSGLIAEIGMEPAHMVRRSSDWARERPFLLPVANAIGRQTTSVTSCSRRMGPPVRCRVCWSASPRQDVRGSVPTGTGAGCTTSGRSRGAKRPSLHQLNAVLRKRHTLLPAEQREQNLDPVAWLCAA